MPAFVFILYFVLLHLNCMYSQDVNVAVVEYQPLIASPNTTSNDSLILNVEKYLSLITEIKNQSEKIDLIVFPEATLNFGVTDILSFATLVRIDVNPCDDIENSTYPNYIQKLSCAARNASTNVVINTIEKEACVNLEEENCKKFGYLLYNTDIVFDTDGKILQSYRKKNLFGEYPLNTPHVTDNVTFSINSVEFGIFTCFDMMFKHPAQDLVESGVRNFIFPSMWFSELPFLTALQTQQMWAMSHNVKLYSAGANNPSRGSGGTSIIGTSGPIVMDIISEDGGIKSYTKDSLTNDDIDSLSKSMDSFYLLIDDNITDYTSFPLVNWNWFSPLDEKHCIDDLCCSFYIEASIGDERHNGEINNTYIYHLIVYSGVRSFGGVYFGGIEICGIAACLNSSISSCGLRFPNYHSINWDTTFENISITLESPATDTKTHYPNSLLSSIRPLSPSKTTWSSTSAQNGDNVKVNFKLDEPQNRLLTFAIYGRNFELDHAPQSDSCNHNVYDIFVLSISTMFVIVFPFVKLL